ncbi:monothiol glutaredoxin-S2-like [Olea europaea var. sylvestris]|nr:monothiol glutaredoxin-S2-like [Olea europaea var. sylvestris]
MQQAIPYKDLLPAATTAANSGITKLVAENPVVVFARSGCCMCHVIKLLLQGHGVNPTIFDINEQNEAATIDEFSKIIDNPEEIADRPPPPFPTVFVGGNLLGGLDEVMAAHISGELVPLLRKAGALWL